MDRTDTKFVFNACLLPSVLEEIKNNYRVVRVEEKCISRYKTLYFDTPNFDFYHAHHNEKLNRYKVRHRTYVESRVSFLEVKFKNNKGQTIKTRISDKALPDINNSTSFSFLESTLPFHPLNLAPKIQINYDRITLINKTDKEKLTLDLSLKFEADGQTKSMNQLVIAEVKQNKKRQSPFRSIMREKHIQEIAISKYCIGVASLVPNVKTNLFKEKLSIITQLLEL